MDQVVKQTLVRTACPKNATTRAASASQLLGVKDWLYQATALELALPSLAVALFVISGAV